MSYEFDEHLTVDGAPYRTVHGRVVLKRPHFARMETRNRNKDVIHIFDGKVTWTYYKATNRYTRQPQDPEPPLTGDLMAALFYGWDLETWIDTEATVTVSEAEIDANPCVVISVADDESDFVIWVDQENLLRRWKLRKMLEPGRLHQVQDYTDLHFSPKLDTDPFTFKPPAGAKEAVKPEELIGPPDESSLLPVGRTAPEFTATDLDGSTVTLSEFKGKALLLNFWFHN